MRKAQPSKASAYIFSYFLIAGLSIALPSFAYSQVKNDTQLLRSADRGTAPLSVTGEELDLKHATMKTIILKLAGWHGYQVQFPADLSTLTFSGSISREGCFLETLHFLERMTGHKIVVKDMKITVKPYRDG